MKTKVTKTFRILFSKEDCELISRLIKERYGRVTVDEILDSFGYSFNAYRALLNMMHKVLSDLYVILEYDEYRALADVLSSAYNSDAEPAKDEIKLIADAIDVQLHTNRDY